EAEGHAGRKTRRCIEKIERNRCDLRGNLGLPTEERIISNHDVREDPADRRASLGGKRACKSGYCEETRNVPAGVAGNASGVVGVVSRRATWACACARSATTGHEDFSGSCCVRGKHQQQS